MSPRKKGKIAVHIQSEVQFFSLKPLLEKLKSDNYDYKVIIDAFESDSTGYGKMAKNVGELVRQHGFNIRPIKEYKDELFDVYLTPYIDGVIKAKCYLKYEYGTLNIKPSLTYIPDVMERYHGFLCQSTITNNLLKAYGATYPVENLRFYGKKKTKIKSERTRVLFAPTYNDDLSGEELREIVESLKTEFYVIVKGHHGTNFLNVNETKKNLLVGAADEYYGSETSLSDLILSVDVCLFGNSSAIGEALYANVPCAIVAKDLDQFRMGDMHSTQYYLAREGILPYSEKVADAKKVVREAMTEKYRKRQLKCANELFPNGYRTGVNGYIDVIEHFLYDADAKEYVELHDYIIQEKDRKIEEFKKEIVELNKMIKEDADEIKKRDDILQDNSKKKLYKVADALYKIEGKILNVKG